MAISLPGLFAALERSGIRSSVVSHQPSAISLHPSSFILPRFDVVHVHGCARTVVRNTTRAARLAGKPYILSPQGALSEGPYHRKSWRDKLRGLLGANSVIRRAAALTALNKYEEHDLRAHSLNPNVRLLPYGLTFGEYKAADQVNANLPSPPEGRCLLMLGPIDPIEGCVPLLKAFAEIGPDADGWTVVMAGPERGDWRKMLEAAVRRKGGEDRVMFTPAPDIATQRGWLTRASIVAVPSLHVRCPVSIMQAVAAGAMVITSDRAAPDGLDGVIRVCRPDRAELREALRLVLRLSDEDRAAATQQAREVATRLFDWSTLAERYAQLYRDVA